MEKITRIVGVISDTHSLLRPEVKEALRGNVDTGTWANKLPLTATAEFARSSIYALHNLEDLALDPAAVGFGAVITGHTHRTHKYWRGKVLFLNPGSAGPKRFDLPVTVARFHVEKNH